MQSILKKLHYRLLPDNSDLGYTPYLWLCYLLFLLPGLLFLNTSTLSYVLTGISVVLFLPLYFYSFRVRVRSKRILICLLKLGLGVALLPFNASASVYFIYAAASAGYLVLRRLSWALIAASAVILILESMLLNFPWYAAAIPALMAVLIGMANHHDAIINQKNAALRQSRQEADRLSRMAERERIGRDLHDLLGHSLSLITLKAELAGKLIQRNSDHANQEIADLESIARESLREVREAVSGYRQTGLHDEISQADFSLKSAGIQLTVKGDIAMVCDQLHEDTERALAMCLREAITNIIRHSQARHCVIELSISEHKLAFTIMDNGKGLQGLSTTEPGRLPNTASGLLGMQQRIEAIGGKLGLKDNDGLTLELIVPVSAPSQGQEVVGNNCSTEIRAPSQQKVMT